MVGVVTSFARYEIEEGQSEFRFDSDLPNPEDYGVSALPSWDTTVFLTEKTNKGFKPRFGTSCPKGGGWLDLSLHTPQRQLEDLRKRGTRSPTRREPEPKLPKAMKYV